MAEQIKTAHTLDEEKIRAKQEEMRTKKLGVGAYIALVICILMFSGIFKDSETVLKGVDFNNWLGAFGKIGGTTGNFLGSGGTGARHGLLLSMSVAPAVFLAMGLMECFIHFGAIDAAGKLLSFILRPIMGVPGYMAIPMMASLTSSDAGASLNRTFHDEGLLTDRERDIMTMWLLCAAGLLTNYITAYSFLSDIITVPFFFPFVLVLLMKFLTANVVRLTWNTLMFGSKKKQAKAADAAAADDEPKE